MIRHENGHGRKNANGGNRVKRGTLRGIGMLLAAALLAIMLSACGSNGADNANDNAAVNANTNANAGTQTSGEDNAAAGNGTNAAAQTDEPRFITVKHGYGETQAPLHPKRVAVFGLEDIMLSLEAPIVYAFDFNGYYLDERIKKLNIAVSGNADFAPNAESILATKPDLIIVQQYSVDQAGYDALSKIAPTLAFVPDDWKSSIVEIGKVLGLEDKAQEVLKAHEDKLASARETIVGAVGPDKTVAYIRPSDKDLQVFFPSFNFVYTDLGLKPDNSIGKLQKETKDDWGITTSLEKLPLLTADYVFAIYGGSIDNEEDYAKAENSAAGIQKLKLWQSIPAVKQNHVFHASARNWMSAGPIAESNEIDEVVAAVTGGQ